MKKMSLDEGLKFMRRHKPKRTAEAGPEINQFLGKAAELANQLFLSLALTDSVENKENLVTFLKIFSEWLCFHKSADNFSDLLRTTFSAAASSKHLYYCAKIIEKGPPETFRILAIELNIRGITMDINEIEVKKQDKDVTAEKLVLSAHYVKLAESFDCNEHVKRECLLTAFSLHPVKEMFDKVKENRLRAEGEHEEQIIDLTEDSYRASSTYREPVDSKAQILLNADTLQNIPGHLHNDLIMVVGSLRTRLLSWCMPWSEISRYCHYLMVK